MSSRITHPDEECTLERGADEDKDTGAQYNTRTDLLNGPESRTPKHRNRNEDEIRVRNDIRNERDPNDDFGNGRLTNV